MVYEFSEKLRIHVSELLNKAKQKYGSFLEEKGSFNWDFKMASYLANYFNLI